MFLVQVSVTFSAALRLFKPELSDEENFRLYGKCANPSGHGHNYTLDVVVAGKLDEETGMVVNFYDLQKAVNDQIFEEVDHRNLNTDVEWLSDVIPTAENMAVKFWERLSPHIRGGSLYNITIAERNGNIISYYGPVDVLPAGAAIRSTAVAAR
jgi:6-pyruvoyltetrahydropterin/6-carboxytetrahydropterin synthase